MPSSLNKVLLIGNVGRDPEVRSTHDGKEIVSFSLATSEAWKDKNTGDKREKTEWHRIVVFAQPLVNIIKNYVRKGSKLYIEGSLQTRKWTDQSGMEKYSTEVVLQSYASTLLLLESKGSSSGEYAAKSPSRGAVKEDAIEDDMEDDIPF